MGGPERDLRRVTAHRAAFGPDRFAVQRPRLALLGLNSELLGSGLHEEAGQWRWLSQELSAPGDERVLVFCHKPLWPPAPPRPRPP